MAESRKKMKYLIQECAADSARQESPIPIQFCAPETVSASYPLTLSSTSPSQEINPTDRMLADLFPQILESLPSQEERFQKKQVFARDHPGAFQLYEDRIKQKQHN